MIYFVLSLGVLVLFVLGIVVFVKAHPQFGANVTPEELQKLEASPNWKDGAFQNLVKTTMDMGLTKIPQYIHENRKAGKRKRPLQDLHVEPFRNEKFVKDGKPKFTWYGHSVLLLQINNKNLLIDPMLGPDAAPIAPFKSARFSANTLEIIDTLPPLDAILFTHDHYDHLDLASVKKLKGKTDHFFVALGVKRHLVKWGIAADKIKEFDWWDQHHFDGIDITFTPSRHFSGRGTTDRAKSLWGGWVFKSAEHNIYWSGDGGYGDHFKEIGERLGPFDWGFMECGQYNALWHAIHMYPEEAIQAAKDSGVKVAIPVHWAGFALAMHTWTDPIERFVNHADDEGQKIATPRLGEIVALGEDKNEAWWTNNTK